MWLAACLLCMLAASHAADSPTRPPTLLAIAHALLQPQPNTPEPAPPPPPPRLPSLQVHSGSIGGLAGFHNNGRLQSWSGSPERQYGQAAVRRLPPCCAVLCMLCCGAPCCCVLPRAGVYCARAQAATARCDVMWSAHHLQPHALLCSCARSWPAGCACTHSLKPLKSQFCPLPACRASPTSCTASAGRRA